MLGINIKHILWTLVGIGLIVICTALMTYVTLWGAAGALPELPGFMQAG